MTEILCIGIIGLLIAGMLVILREVRLLRHILTEALKQEPIKHYPAFSDPATPGAVTPRRWTDYEDLEDKTEWEVPPPRRAREKWLE